MDQKTETFIPSKRISPVKKDMNFRWSKPCQSVFNRPRYDALRHLVPFTEFKKREKHPWRSVNFSKVILVTLLHGCFSRFLNCANDTKSRNASHMRIRMNSRHSNVAEIFITAHLGPRQHLRWSFSGISSQLNAVNLISKEPHLRCCESAGVLFYV